MGEVHAPILGLETWVTWYQTKPRQSHGLLLLIVPTLVSKIHKYNIEGWEEVVLGVLVEYWMNLSVSAVGY